MNGIIYIAFGKSYDKMLAYCLSYSIKFINIPILILSNLKEEERDEKWKSIKNVKFKYIEDLQKDNRNLKTSINKFSPFDKTLYLDADCIVQKNGIEKIFDRINDDSINLNLYSRWNKNKKIPRIYVNHFKINSVQLPMNIYYGAICGFGKSDKIDNFFKIWNEFWVNTGKGRDMPSLASAVVKSGISVNELTNKDKFFTWLLNKDFVIQHEYGRHVRNLIGCSDFNSFKPFDERNYEYNRA